MSAEKPLTQPEAQEFDASQDEKAYGQAEKSEGSEEVRRQIEERWFSHLDTIRDLSAEDIDEIEQSAVYKSDFIHELKTLHVVLQELSNAVVFQECVNQAGAGVGDDEAAIWSKMLEYIERYEFDPEVYKHKVDKKITESVVPTKPWARYEADFKQKIENLSDEPGAAWRELADLDRSLTARLQHITPPGVDTFSINLVRALKATISESRVKVVKKTLLSRSGQSEQRLDGFSDENLVDLLSKYEAEKMSLQDVIEKLVSDSMAESVALDEDSEEVAEIAKVKTEQQLVVAQIRELWKHVKDKDKRHARGYYSGLTSIDFLSETNDDMAGYLDSMRVMRQEAQNNPNKMYPLTSLQQERYSLVELNRILDSIMGTIDRAQPGKAQELLETLELKIEPKKPTEMVSKPDLAKEADERTWQLEQEQQELSDKIAKVWVRLTPEQQNYHYGFDSVQAREFFNTGKSAMDYVARLREAQISFNQIKSGRPGAGQSRLEQAEMVADELRSVYRGVDFMAEQKGRSWPTPSRDKTPLPATPAAVNNESSQPSTTAAVEEKVSGAAWLERQMESVSEGNWIVNAGLVEHRSLPQVTGEDLMKQMELYGGSVKLNIECRDGDTSVYYTIAYQLDGWQLLADNGKVNRSFRQSTDRLSQMMFEVGRSVPLDKAYLMSHATTIESLTYVYSDSGSVAEKANRDGRTVIERPSPNKPSRGRRLRNWLAKG